MINRYILSNLKSKLLDNKAILVFGPRQVGKSTLIKELLLKNESYIEWNGDDASLRNLLEDYGFEKLKNLIGDHKIIFIDEAQRIKDIGIIIKIIVDRLPGRKVIASGSSSFELANKLNEPLTGRKWEYTIYPLSWSEMIEYHGYLKELSLLEHRLIYGYYPEVINNDTQAEESLRTLCNSYLYKDVLQLSNISKPDKIERLVQAISLQLGNLVSYNELSQVTGLNVETVEKYISILEHAYIIHRLGSFRRNIRTELNKSRKIYFYDNGIRNAVINNFTNLNQRTDLGALWENFLINERIKYYAKNNIYVNKYFWRTKDQSEIDYIEERNGKIAAYEFKYNSDKHNFNKNFIEHYHPIEKKIINKNNFMEWLK